MRNPGKIALVHEMLVKFGGAEKVVESILKKYPEADVFTLIYNEQKVGDFFPKNKINPQVFKLPSQKIYNLTKKQRLCLPFMARSIEKLDLSEYDTVIVSSSGFTHGIITKPETRTIIYYHSPARYMWDWTNEYKRDIKMNSGIKGFLLNSFLLKARIWDFIASQRHDITLANSQNTANRIKKYYKKNAKILYPPVETKRFQAKISQNFEKVFDEYYIIISALTEFKRLDVAIKSFVKMPEKNLIIIGKGELENKLKNMANGDFLEDRNKNTGKNIFFAGPKYGEELVFLVQNSIGMIFPGEEDFGIVPVEALSAGKPVFALKKGGLLETIQAGKNGEFFEDKDGSDFIEKFLEFDAKNKNGKYSEEYCKNSADKYNEENFHKQLENILIS